MSSSACTGQPGGVEGQMRSPAGTAQRQTRRGLYNCLMLQVEEGMHEQCKPSAEYQSVHTGW